MFDFIGQAQRIAGTVSLAGVLGSGFRDRGSGNPAQALVIPAVFFGFVFGKLLGVVLPGPASLAAHMTIEAKTTATEPGAWGEVLLAALLLGALRISVAWIDEPREPGRAPSNRVLLGGCMLCAAGMVARRILCGYLALGLSLLFVR